MVIGGNIVMPMEQEVMPLLITGVSVVIILSFIIVTGLWVLTKITAYAWIIAHLVFLSLSISRWIYLLGANKSHDTMISESNSLIIGGAAVLWAISVGFLMIGVYKLGSVKK